jgi:DNA-binding response OmpR family regulator
MSTILLIEDNRDYAATLKGNLEREGYRVTISDGGRQGLEDATRERPSLVILDLMLPGMDGFAVLQRLRERGLAMPVLILTALGTEEEKLRGFGLGGDDYLVKPCGLRELLARVRALLKRGGSALPAPVQVGDLSIDLAAREVRRSSEPIELRPKEFELLAALIRHRGRVVSRAELLREVWGYVAGIESRTVETHLAALRQRLGDDSKVPRYIVTVRGAGYRLAG